MSAKKSEHERENFNKAKNFLKILIDKPIQHIKMSKI